MKSVDPMLYDAYHFRPSYFGAAFTWPQDHCSKEYASPGLRSWEVDDPDYVILVDTSFERIRITLAELYRDVTMLAEEAIIQGGAEELQSTLKTYALPHLQAIQAVILRGDGNVSRLHQVRSILQRVVPEIEGKVKKCKGGCEFVNAIGAACVARQLTLYPDFMDDGDPGYTGMGLSGHDEL